MTSILIAGASTGSGKTVITSAILRALRNRNINAMGAKVGPDYIDPKFHSIASYNPAYNLDCWAMNTETISRNLKKLESKSDITIIEGVMGLFDGAADGTASPAHLAKQFKLPVILALDAFGQSQSISAIVKGFDCLDDDINILGVILTKVGSQKHHELLKNSLEKYLPHIPLLGSVRRSDELLIESRHLGLVQPNKQNNDKIDKFIDKTADIIENSIDIDKLISIAKPSLLAEQDNIDLNKSSLPSLGKHIAVAYDEAFSFCYPHMIDEWERNNIKISYFSPMADEAVDENCDAIYLCGGYPELYAEKLANNMVFKNSVRKQADKGKIVFGECGGYMTLGNSITDKDGKKHKMLGLLDIDTSFEKRKLHLGYRNITLLEDCALGRSGDMIRGHEFHYSTIIQQSGKPLFSVSDALGNKLGNAGLINGNVYGSYMHLIDVFNEK